LSIYKTDGKYQVPSATFINELSFGFAYLLEKQLSVFIDQSDSIVLALDSSTSARVLPVCALLAIDTATNSEFLISLVDTTAKKAVEIFEMVVLTLQKEKIYEKLGRKLSFILSDGAASQLKANSLLKSKFEADFDRTVNIVRCHMHIGAIMEKRCFDRYISLDTYSVFEALQTSKILFGSRLVSSFSASSRKSEFLAELSRDYPGVRIPSTTFRTDTGSRYSVASSNSMSLLLFETTIKKVVERYK